MSSEEAGHRKEATMRASYSVSAVAVLALAAGSSVLGATEAGAGLRAVYAARPAVSVLRGVERHAGEQGRRRYRRDFEDQLGLLGLLGAGGPTVSGTPAGQGEETEQPAVFFPRLPAFGRLAADHPGPKIIEIGGHASAARRTRLPVVVYGDPSP